MKLQPKDWLASKAPQMLHGVHSFVPVVMRAVVPRRVEPVVMEPVVVVQRQFSAPCLVRKASLTAPAAPPGQGHGFVQPEGQTMQNNSFVSARVEL